MHIELPQIISQIINFGVVLGALSYLLYKPILKILDERANKIAQAQKDAEAMIAEKQSLDEEKKKVKQQAEKQANEIIEKAKRVAEEQAALILENASKEVEAKKAKALETISHDKAAMEQTMKAEFNDAVMVVAEKVIGNILAKDAKAQSKLINDEISAILKTM